MRLRVLTRASALKVRYTFLRSKLQGNIPGHIAPTLAFPFLSAVDATSGPYSGFGSSSGFCWTLPRSKLQGTYSVFGFEACRMFSISLFYEIFYRRLQTY